MRLTPLLRPSMPFLAAALASSLCLPGCAEATPPPATATATPAVQTPAPPAASPADNLARGRAWTLAFYRNDTHALWEAFSEEMRQTVGSEAGLVAFRAKVEHDLGHETEMVSEEGRQAGGGVVYERLAHFEKFPGAVRVTVATTTSADGERVVGFAISPDAPTTAAPTTKLDYRTHAALRLPFDGEWTVFWGGHTLAENYHAISREQRFAYDFVRVENGVTHRGDGRANTDYFAYGQPIVAPAGGKIVALVDGIAENRPGEMNAKDIAGNYVILDLGHEEYALFAHLVPGSLRVKLGDEVATGQRLGACGNSGHSSEPHLHFHLQNSPDLGDGDGLPAQFEDYLADDAKVLRGEPVRGQRVRADAPSRTARR